MEDDVSSLSSARSTWETIKVIEHRIKLEARQELLRTLHEWYYHRQSAPASEVLDLIETLNKDYERKSI